MLRLFLLSVSIGAALVGGLYAASGADRVAASALVVPVGIVESVETAAPPVLTSVAPEVEELPTGLDFAEEDAVLVDAYSEEVLDEEMGLRFGLFRATEPFALDETHGRRRSARPEAPALPVLHLASDPGRNVILVARSMMSRNETVRGSCYRYVSAVFERAGHDGWRTRTIVQSSPREGPYANLDLIRPGDWLYIVNHPERTPVGTHSVIFVGWENRAEGYAHVIEHPGGGADMAGQERGYDVSRTYRIVRPTAAH